MADFIPVEQLNNEAQAGWDAQQAEFRKAAAYNALAQQYGPQAGDPAAALAMQKYGFDEQNNPLLIQQQQGANTAQSQTNAFNAANNPQLLQHQALQNTGQATTNAFNDQKVQDAQLSSGQAQGQQAHAIISTALGNLAQEAQGITDPNQLGALFDKHTNAAMNLINPNADPATVAQQTAAERQAFVQGGAAAVPGIQSQLDQAINSQQSPLDQAKVGTQNAQTSAATALAAQRNAAATQIPITAAQKAAAGQSKQDNDDIKTYTKVYGTPQKLQQTIGAAQAQISQKIDTVLGDPNQVETDANGNVTAVGQDGQIAKVLQLQSQLNGQSPAMIAAKENIPGTTAYAYAQALEQLQHNVALTDIGTMRANGLSLGRVTNTEFLAAGKAIANLSPTADPTTMRTQLGQVAKTWAAMRADQQGQVDQMGRDLQGFTRLTKGGKFDTSPGAGQPALAPDPTTTQSIGQPGTVDQNGNPVPQQQSMQQLPPGGVQLPPGGVQTPPAVQAAQAQVAAPQNVQQIGDVVSPNTPQDPRSLAQLQQAASQAQAQLPAGQRVIQNFVAAPNTAPLQQALANSPGSLPAGMRNNNPGNIKYVGQAGTSPSSNKDEGDPQAVYATPQAGMDAMSTLLQKKYDGGKVTPDQMIAGQGGWTPGNHDAAANVAKTMGIGPNDDINMNDPMQKAKFMRALMLQEHGPKSRLYPDAMILAAVGAGSAPAGATQPNTPPTAQTAAAAPQQPANALNAGLMQAPDTAPVAPQQAQAARQAAPASGAAQLQTMTPAQVATQPVSLPSAVDLRVAQQAPGAAASQGGARAPGQVLSADNILAQYGLKRKAS